MATQAPKSPAKPKTAKKAAKKTAAKQATTAKKAAAEAPKMTAPALADKLRAQDPFGFQAEWAPEDFLAAQQDAQKALETLGRKTVEFTQANIEASTAATQEMMGVKDVTDLVELQTAYVSEAMERGAAQFMELQSLALEAFSASGKPFGTTNLFGR